MSHVLTLGEIMMRLSTNKQTRLASSSTFDYHFGGAEANVAVSLAQFGHNVSFASKVPEQALGVAASQQLTKYGVSTEPLLFGGDRLGLYFLESGAGQRPAQVLYDRKQSSFAAMDEWEWDKDALFAGVDLLHLSGITPALSTNWAKWIVALVKEAKARKINVSFDLNYRGKLWGQAQAKQVFNEIVPYVDYLSAGALDATHFFGVERAEDGLLYKDTIHDYYNELKKQFPQVTAFYSTQRDVHSAERHDLTGFLWSNNRLHQSKTHQLEAIVDRVGAGDAFTAGILHGLLSQLSSKETVSFATAAAALKHTVAGDANLFQKHEVEAFAQQTNAAIQR